MLSIAGALLLTLSSCGGASWSGVSGARRDAQGPTAAADERAARNTPLASPDDDEVGVDLVHFERLRAAAARGAYDRPCGANEHDPSRWHPLVDETRGCHYDHHHGDDPHLLDDVFGEPGAWFGRPGQSVSYPWQTFKIPFGIVDRMITPEQLDTPLENQHGHEMYYWVVRRNQPCDANGYCVTDFRIHFHGDTTFSHAETRYHSIAAEVRACGDALRPETCGIIRTGGWMDYGRLFTPPYGQVPRGQDCGNLVNGLDLTSSVVPLPVDTLFGAHADAPGRVDEFRCHQILPAYVLADAPRVTDDTALAEWWGHGATDFRFQLFVYDPISNITEAGLDSGVLQAQFICPRGALDCPWNNSVFSASLGYILPLNNGIIGDHTRDGVAHLALADRRFVTRWGQRNDACAEVGLDCIPIEYDGLPLKEEPGHALEGFVHHRCITCRKVDHDLTPPGRPSWIDWYYRMGEAHVH